MADPPGREVAHRDEVLELLYWLEGEGLEDSATLAGLARFLVHEEADVRRTLDALVRRGDVLPEEEGAGRYRLSEVGRREAARRFAEEFAPLLSQGHGECNDPDCDCHANPAGAAECHAARGGGHAHG
ncbi:MAG: hypothetical protein ABR599_10430 [Gemmatimonadota bacterium]